MAMRCEFVVGKNLEAFDISLVAYASGYNKRVERPENVPPQREAFPPSLPQHVR